MSKLFDQNGICALHGIKHAGECPGLNWDPNELPPPAPKYATTDFRDGSSTDSAGRKIDGRGKLIKEKK